MNQQIDKITQVAASTYYSNCAGSPVELFNYLNNVANLNAAKSREFRRFETEMKWGDFVPAHCAARLMEIAHNAAQQYVKEYCGRDVRYRDIFPLADRLACAELLAAEFIIEKHAGNSWL